MTTFSSSPPNFFICLLLSFATLNNINICSGEVVSTLQYIHGFKNYHELRLPNNTSGPESLAFDCDGEGPYTGVSDGRILKWRPTHREWIEFAVTSPHRDRKLCDGSTDPDNEPICGRPLGLKFHTKTCHLYIADAYFGLLMVGPNGGVAQQLPVSADDDAPFKFLNGLDIDEQNDVIYFTETSTVYQKREWKMIVLNGDKTGRLLRYDSRSKKVQVLLKGLTSANGVAVSKDSSFLLAAESGSHKIQKFWLKGHKAYTSELFAQFEKRPPDNIVRNKNGDFWVALNSDSTSLKNADNAILQNQAQMYDVPWRKEEEEEEEEDADPVGVKFDEKGNTLEVLDGRGRPELLISEVNEHNGKLWIGSPFKPYVVVEMCLEKLTFINLI